MPVVVASPEAVTFHVNRDPNSRIMTALPLLHRIADQLLAIEAEMRHIGFWDSESPSPEALASTLPFCYDTLSFQQWLQWIFIPRMREVIEHDTPLPAASHIAPLAEHSFAQLAADTRRLEQLIVDFDRLMAQR